MFHLPNFYRRKNQLFIAQSRHPLSANYLPPLHDSKMSKVREVLSEFCAKSTMHGFAYIADRKQHRIERCWWIFVVVVSILLCGHSIHNEWIKWKRDQVIITFDSETIPVGDIPSPAVSICPITKSCSKKFNYTDVYRAMLKLDGNSSRNVSEDELKMMRVASQLCDERIALNINELFHEEFSDHSILSTIEKISPEFHEIIIDCTVFDVKKNCSDIFYPAMTEIGLCFTVNALGSQDFLTDQISPDFWLGTPNQPSSNWSADSGYLEEPFSSEETYPRRAIGTGFKNGLILLLRVSKNDIDDLCSGGIQGFDVVLHPPNEGPQVSRRNFYLSPGKSILLSVEPTKTVTVDDARAYAPEVRGCFFDGERKLRFYKQYTQRNCELECLSNITLGRCGCVKFSTPRSSDMKVCGPAKMRCCHMADKGAFSYANLVCNCRQSCSKISYIADTSEAEFDLVSAINTLANPTDWDLNNAIFSRLIITFNDEHFTPMIRIESSSKFDVLANCGGLFGLFMGASLLSIIEMIYYFSLRMYFAFRDVAKSNPVRHISFIPFVPRKEHRQPLNGQTNVFTYLP